MQEFLARHNIPTPTLHNARKEPLNPSQAWARLRNEVTELYVVKGNRPMHFRIGDQKLSDEEIEKLLAGPTGNLRAPILRVGKKLLVGFEEATCRQLLGV